MSVKVHEAFSIDSFQDRLLWWDDFLGDQLQDEWAVGGTGSATVVDQQTGGIVRITSGAATNNSYIIFWNDIRSLHVLKKVSIEVRVKLSSTTDVVSRLRLYFDFNNYIGFYFNAAVDATWDIICRDGGVSTDATSTIAADTSNHIFRIECHTHGSNHVHFYIDGVQTANSPITTNIPDDASDFLQPYLFIQTAEDVAKSLDIDYVVVRQEV